MNEITRDWEFLISGLWVLTQPTIKKYHGQKYLINKNLFVI